ncbi:MAG TPA: histidinol dehydrogenase [Geminicoccaceae bacterium]|nr:histidinol dehydrogenase [Geminicoccaceae bacterium]
MAQRLDDRAPAFDAAFAELVERPRGARPDVARQVEAVLARIASDGDAALLEYTAQFDRQRLRPEQLRVGADEIARAVADCPAELRRALELAAARIGAFHRHQLPQPLAIEDDLGVELGLRWQPIAAVGIYVPGGTAAYPSSVLMNALPAKIAGVGRLVMTVPAPDGALDPLVLVAADLAGVDEIYRVGGAQAIGALAFGTQTIAAVDKIVGPGNAYVAEAKRQVFGRVGIDMIAGPSEIVVVADRDQDPAWVAADLLSQAEHDELAQAVLITDSEALADAVAATVEAQLAELPRRAIAAASWRAFGAIVLVQDLSRAPALVDLLAPEHLELLLADPAAMAARIRNAGAMFLGPHTPEVIGDYVGGPNHVLPTDRSARFASGLSVFDFLKRTTLLSCTAGSLAQLGPAAATLARAEGLAGHARAIELRLGAARPG